MKRTIAVLLSLVILLALPACQPTPEKGTVVQKDSDRMLGEAQKSPMESVTTQSLSEQYGIPKAYTYDAQGADGKLNIHVDARVIAPDGNAIPIYRVKKSEFSQEIVSAFFNELCGGAEMWAPSGQRTKGQIQEQILQIKKDIRQGVVPEDMLEDVKKTLANLEEQVMTAPDTITEERVDGTMREISETHEKGHIPVEGGEEPEDTVSYETVTYTGLDAYERYDKGLDGRGRTIQVRNDINSTIWYNDCRNPASGVNFSSSGTVPVIEDTDIDAETLSKAGIRPSEAGQMVQGLLDKTGSGMTVDSIYLQNDEQKGNYDEAVRPAERYAYQIYCVRKIGGIPCSYIRGGSKPDTADMMAPSWVYEEMYFMVNGKGIFEMMWHNPIEVLETVNTDARLKPFSEIKEIFEKMMLIKYEPQAELYGGLDFEINRATLSLHRIIEQDSNENGLLVPAWNFYGKLTLGPSGGNRFDKLGETFMTINAIDGSVIDTSKGY